jgi:hypothetical protein
LGPFDGGGSADGGPSPLLDGALPPFIVTSEPWQKDATGSSGLAPSVIDGLRNAARAAGAGAPGQGGASAAASSCADMIYPYESTVFPAGLRSPPWMFASGFDAAYARIGYAGTAVLDYEVAAPAAQAGELLISEEDWAQIVGRTTGAPLVVTFAFQRGGATSTCTARVVIAGGRAMSGSVYYNTYNHPEAGGLGAVVRLRLGEAQSQLYLNMPGTVPTGPCKSCHSLSVNGQVLAASEHGYAPFAGYFQASAYSVTDGVQPQKRGEVGDATFGALYPDGSLLLQMGNPQCTAGADTFPRAPNNFMLAPGKTAPTLLDTSTGQKVAASGVNPDFYMWMPQFSPDGKRVVFNHAKPDGSGGTDRRELAVMDFDVNTRTFSNLRVIASRLGVAPSLDYSPGPAFFVSGLGGTVASGADNCRDTSANAGGGNAAIPGGACTGPCYPAWPFFTPDGKGVIFSLISEPDFAVAFPGRNTPSKSELWYVDVGTGTTVRLDKANTGLEPGDSLANYYPTVLPIPVGGYFWMFWTSTRKYGHHSTEAPPGAAVVGEALYGPSAREAFKKRLWVSAIVPPAGGEFTGGPLTDPSRPGFYLDGQSATGNTRAFAALNPCKATGNDCRNGFDCCTGLCNWNDATKTGQCVDTLACSKEGDKCTTDASCCPDQGLSCIGGFCGTILK